MATANTLRNDLIDKLLTISDKNYLQALNQLIDSSTVNRDVVNLSEEQILMLQLSDRNIAEGKLISQSELDKNDLRWLKGKCIKD